MFIAERKLSKIVLVMVFGVLVVLADFSGAVAQNENAPGQEKQGQGKPGGGNDKLDVDLVDSRGKSVKNPVVFFSPATTSFEPTETEAILGTDALRIEVNNDRNNPVWSLALSASETAVWEGGGNSEYFYNDPTPNGRGRLTIDPSGALIEPLKSSCRINGILPGSLATFSRGEVNSVTLVTANASASQICGWQITNISLWQVIPPAQPAGNYYLDMVLTIS